MEWMFLITAYNRARVESRVLQVLDHHMVYVQSFASMRVGNEIRVTFLAEADRAGAAHTRELLNKLQDIKSVDAFATKDGMCRTLAFFNVLCDHESRLPLLQVIAALGAQVVAIRPDFVAFQLVGTPQDIEGVYVSLLPYGLIEGISVASAAVRKQPTSEVSVNTGMPESSVPAAIKKSAQPKMTELRHAAV